MTMVRTLTAKPVDAPAALELALEQSHEVKVKVEGCADDLASANDVVKKKIAEGATTLPAHKALQDGEKVETKVQECADDLNKVTETLAHGIEDIRQIEIALTESRKALSETEAALVHSQEDEKLARLRALHDAATGLPNRDLFDDRLAQAISLADRHNWTLAVMFLDLDRFKSINDTHGHAAGDLVLKEVASRMMKHARHEDTVCRNGGDEFLYLVVNPQGSENTKRIAELVLKKISEPIDFGHVKLVVKPSIGIAVYLEGGPSADQLIRNADAAMYHAKKLECGYVFYDPLEASAS